MGRQNGCLEHETVRMTPPSDDDSIAFPCPSCGTDIQKTIGWLLRNDRLGCGCGAHFRVNASALRAGLAAVRGAPPPDPDRAAPAA